MKRNDHSVTAWDEAMRHPLRTAVFAVIAIGVVFGVPIVLLLSWLS